MLDPDGTSRPGTSAPSASRATRPPRSSASTSRSSIRPRTSPRASASASSRSRPHEGRFEEEGWRVRKDGTRFWANVIITALRDPNGDAGRLRQGHPGSDRAARGRGGGAPLPAARRERQGLRDLHARPRRPRRAPGTPAPSASRATRPTRSSASTSRSSIRPRTSPRARCERELEVAARDGPLRGGGLAHPQGRLALLGQRHHHRAARPRAARWSASRRSPAISPSAAKPRRAHARWPRRRPRWRRRRASRSSRSASWRSSATTCATRWPRSTWAPAFLRQRVDRSGDDPGPRPHAGQLAAHVAHDRADPRSDAEPSRGRPGARSAPMDLRDDDRGASSTSCARSIPRGRSSFVARPLPGNWDRGSTRAGVLEPRRQRARLRRPGDAGHRRRARWTSASCRRGAQRGPAHSAGAAGDDLQSVPAGRATTAAPRRPTGLGLGSLHLARDGCRTRRRHRSAIQPRRRNDISRDLAGAGVEDPTIEGEP